MDLTANVNPRLMKILAYTAIGDTHMAVSIFSKPRVEYKAVLMLEENDFTSKEKIATNI